MLFSIFYENRFRAAWLTTREVKDLTFFFNPRKALSSYEIGTILADMPQVERISPDGESPARWRLKEEVL